MKLLMTVTMIMMITMKSMQPTIKISVLDTVVLVQLANLKPSIALTALKQTYGQMVNTQKGK